MNCCGQKRKQWQSEVNSSPANPAVKPETVMEQPVTIYYSGNNHYFAKGRYTGILYLFAPGNGSLLADFRDVPSLLQESQKLSR